MSLAEIIETMRDKIQSQSDKIIVTGIILEPYLGYKNMSCYTSIDSNNPELFLYNKEKKNNYIDIHCIYSKQYLLSANGKSRRRRPLKQECDKCSFTPRQASSYKAIIDCYLKGNIEENVCRDIVKNAIKQLNAKFSIEIKTGILKIKRQEVFSLNDF